MVDIGTSDKITNLWPATPSRLIEKSGLKEKSSQDHRRKKKNKEQDDIIEDGPGKNIDEYA